MFSLAPNLGSLGSDLYWWCIVLVASFFKSTENMQPCPGRHPLQLHSEKQASKLPLITPELAVRPCKLKLILPPFCGGKEEEEKIKIHPSIKVKTLFATLSEGKIKSNYPTC